MKRKLIIFFFSFLTIQGNILGRYWPGDTWYNNPLGFEPLKLHTAMGFILPAMVSGLGLLFTQAEPSTMTRTSFFNESGFSWGYKYPYTFFSQNNSGLDFQLRKWLSLGLEFDIYFPVDAYNQTVGLAIRPFARFYLINAKFWKFYFETGGGLVYFLRNFPKPTAVDSRLGTNLNGVTKYGLGIQIHLNRLNSVMFGIRHLHISNGNAKGVARNPSHDSNGFFIGFSFLPETN